MSISTFNRRWAAVLLEVLSRHGVSHVCIAPGSRSTPLTLEAAAHKRFVCHTHFDERGLGHLALGLAKASRQPVAVIVTSGTAVANLYPALIEAGLTGERLVLITADRPAELIDCGANQAIRQEGIFSSHPAVALNLPRPSPDISAAWLASAVDSAMADAESGGLHINCPFSEPLYGGDPDEYLAWSQQLGAWWQSKDRWLNQTSMRENVMQLDWPLWRLKRGVIIAGRLTAQEGDCVAEWAKNLGWPLLSDVLSSTGQPLPHADLWLNHPQAQSILAKSELVIQFGSSLTGKRMLQWQARSTPTEYWLVDSLKGRLDPANHRGRRIVGDIRQWLALHPTAGRHQWAESLNGLVEQTKNYVQARLVETFTEASIARRLPELLPEDGQLFVGNSLIVRLVDAMAQLPRGYPVYSNRGASGIDGLISTSAGVLRATGKPTLAIMGDISALYDLNSLSLFSQRTDAPMVLIVINNNGGSIFSLLPTPEQERERFYRMPHGFNFKHAAAMFGLSYICPESRQELNEAVDGIWSKGGMLLVEINVPEHQGAQTLREMVQRAGDL